MSDINKDALNEIYRKALNRSPDPSAISSYLELCNTSFGRLKVWKDVVSSSESRRLPALFRRAVESFPFRISTSGPRLEKSERGELVFFTIISKNYLAYANTLMQSVKDVHPNCARYLCLVDEYEHSEDFRTDLYEVVAAKSLKIPEIDAFFFRYEIMELNTAVKPYMFKFLLDMHVDSGICYLDPDLFLLKPLKTIETLVERGASLVLTPHLNDLVTDDKQPSELAIMRSGVYNCGFVVLGKVPESKKIVDWWAKKLEFHCYVDLEAGLFTDQKWMDLAPGLFNSVSILRDDGYNLAYWNLAQRKIKKHANNDYSVNGMPLTFVHFSGISLEKPDIFSKHQDRFTANDIGDLVSLYKYYLSRLEENRHPSLSKSKYAYAYFENGEEITKWHRLVYRKYFDTNSSGFIKKPFETNTAIFAEPTPELAINSRLRVSMLMMEIWKSRIDLQKAFDLKTEAGRSEFIVWYLGTKEISIHYSHNRIVHDCYDGKYNAAALTVVNGRVIELDNRGVNLIGYARGEFGVAEIIRSYARSLVESGYPFVIHDLQIGVANRREDDSMAKHFSKEFPYDKNIFFVNADQMPIVHKHLGQSVFSGRKNIGYWFWELENFPDVWVDSIGFVDEVWTASEFIRKAVQARTEKPVRIVHVPIAINLKKTYTKKNFKLRDNCFTFLFSFDFNSFISRKNPSAVIAAFNRAFPKKNENVCLYIKTINGNSHPHYLSALNNQIKTDRRIIVSDGYLSRDDMYGLESVIDCYISLHRSEGLGLGMAESMYFGKPVIATNYSGNIEFMTDDNSCLVDYDLVDVQQGEYPHSKDQKWADPSVESAAKWMKRVFEDKALRKKISTKAMNDIKSTHAFKKCGQDLITLLIDLQKNSNEDAD